MRRVPTPEPHRTEIVRRLDHLPPRDDDPTGATIVWAGIFLALWLAAGVVAFIVWGPFS